MLQSEIKFYRRLISKIRADFHTRYGSLRTKKGIALKNLLFSRQSGRCFYCGESINLDDFEYSQRRIFRGEATVVRTSTCVVGHIKSVKHCAIEATSEAEACEAANRIDNLALIHGNPCNSFVGSDDMVPQMSRDIGAA